MKHFKQNFYKVIYWGGEKKKDKKKNKCSSCIFYIHINFYNYKTTRKKKKLHIDVLTNREIV